MNLHILKAVIALLDAGHTYGNGQPQVAEAYFYVASRHIADAITDMQHGRKTGPQWEFLAGTRAALRRLLDDEAAPTEKPRRVQLQRSKGWKMPPNTVKVDRSTKWGNPIKPGNGTPRAQAVVHFRQMLEEMDPEEMEALLLPLRGRNLACWCKLDEECHADVWLELANQ